MATRNERTIGVTEFKAKCLDVIDQLAARTLNRVVVTKRGRPVAVMEPPPEVQAQTAEERFDAIYGCIKDWPAPVPLEHEWEKPQYTDPELDGFLAETERQVYAMLDSPDAEDSDRAK